MSFFDTLLGRTKPVQPDLDVFFAIPAAAIGLEAGLALVPTGAGAVCVKSPEGAAAAAAQAEALSLYDAEVSQDEFGCTWLACRRPDGDLAALVTDMHAVNTAFVDAGLGPSLLCTVLGFEGGGRKAGLVYLYKRGSIYPFVQTGPQTRDTSFELQIRAQLTGELPIEKDLSRWFPLWNAPGLPR